ncbi:PRC-barrel domain-containing protein [Actinoplanes sp. TRM 88003]|uniref:PRC-barrel domain-containing protein n=1 Tax=Paractinoplanes aksuensis TaxID=2939490 RepID=A0ABT1E3U8_9ACTN|nr:PRC-barrel domain-containing protein [Actinoplanes aksuensis]MCO8277665.1 PRC-barrel domain-containing protein [Actinoplanes aksuensis]
MRPFAFVPWTWRDPVSPGRGAGARDVGDPTLDADRLDSARADEQASADLAGYDVEATDGGIGKIDEATYDVGSSYLVVDTGPWIFGRKVLLPAGTVDRIDHDARAVYVDRTKDQIKDSPEYDKGTFDTPEYREQVGDYYAASYRDAPST